MPSLRFTRDKRGYEHFQLVETTTRRGRTRTKVLYWFRTPPGVKVGREPFDEETRRMLEAKNPSVVFDWKRIAATPLPSADAEKWRERRREERAAKRARRVREADKDEASAFAASPLQREEADVLEPAEALEPFESLEPLEEPEADEDE